MNVSVVDMTIVTEGCRFGTVYVLQASHQLFIDWGNLWFS